MDRIKAATFTASPYAFLCPIRAMLVTRVLATSALEVLGSEDGDVIEHFALAIGTSSPTIDLA